MKNILKPTWMKSGLIALVALSVAFAALELAPTLAMAQTPSPSTPATPPAAPATPATSQNQAARQAALEKAFAREQTASTTQANNLEKMSTLAAKAQALIDKAKANGRDVTGIQLALNAFKSQVADAQSLHDTAAGILSAHVGFDDSGKVTGMVAAAETVRDAHQSLVDTRNVMRQAAADLRSAIRAFRAAHKGKTS